LPGEKMKKILLIVACLMFIYAGNTLAQVEQLSHSFELGSEIYHITYKEPGIMNSKGVMYGVAGSYRCKNQKNYIAKIDGRLSYGRVDYKGSTWGGTPLTINDIPDYSFEVRGLMGYDHVVSKGNIITPFFGIGYRYLNDDASKKYHGGYERESKYFYSPVGLEGVVDMGKGWSLGATIEYDIFWQGIQRSHLSNVDSALNDQKNKQKKGYGLRGSIKLKKQGDKIGFVMEPFIRYWNIDDSEITALSYDDTLIGYGYEPKNNSTEIGCKVGMTF
jgi:hypothetical protein